MTKTVILGLTAGFLLAGGVPTDLAAQGKGKGKVKQPDRQERVERDRQGSGGILDVLRGRTADRRDDDRRDDDRRDRRDRDDDRYDDRYENRGAERGPKFCQNGQGHPVHGRRWCAEKGFGLGTSLGSLGNVRWEDRGWEDVIFRSPRSERDVVNRGGLMDVLGSVVLGRFDQQARTLGTREPLTGRWLEGQDGPRVLWLQAGQTPIAQLLDNDRDGRVDRIRLNGGR